MDCHFQRKLDYRITELFLFSPSLSDKYDDTYHSKIQNQSETCPYQHRLKPSLYNPELIEISLTFVVPPYNVLIANHKPFWKIIQKKLLPFIFRGSEPETVTHDRHKYLHQIPAYKGCGYTKYYVNGKQLAGIQSITGSKPFNKYIEEGKDQNNKNNVKKQGKSRSVSDSQHHFRFRDPVSVEWYEKNTDKNGSESYA